MSLQGILDAVDEGLKVAAKLAPFAAQFGGPIGAMAAGIVTSASSVVDNIDQRVKEGSLVATSTNVAQIEALAQKVQDLNEELDTYIQNS